jgi:hypothetical protein
MKFTLPKIDVNTYIIKYTQLAEIQENAQKNAHLICTIWIIKYEHQQFSSDFIIRTASVL